jgi:hypothetical protein
LGHRDLLYLLEEPGVLPLVMEAVPVLMKSSEVGRVIVEAALVL